METRIFADKTLLVTGGGGDIGKATAKWFASRGAKIAVVDMRDDAVGAAVMETSFHGC